MSGFPFPMLKAASERLNYCKGGEECGDMDCLDTVCSLSTRQCIEHLKTTADLRPREEAIARAKKRLGPPVVRNWHGCRTCARAQAKQTCSLRSFERGDALWRGVEDCPPGQMCKFEVQPWNDFGSAAWVARNYR